MLMHTSIFLIAAASSLEQQTTVNLTPYATSAFQEHSLISTVYVVQAVVNGKRASYPMSPYPSKRIP